jgi:hypothetical protein
MGSETCDCKALVRGDCTCSKTIKFESDIEQEVWSDLVITAMTQLDGDAAMAIEAADKVLRALQERQPEEPVSYVPVDLLGEGLSVYLAEQVSVALQRLPTDLGTEWTGKRREDLAVHQGIVADAIAEALQSRSAEIVASTIHPEAGSTE